MSELEPYTPPTAPWVEMLQPTWELAKRLERAKEFVPAEFNNRAEAIMAAILTGAELGRGPMWSLRSMHVVNGKPGLSAEAMRALVLAAGHEIWLTEHTDHTVTIAGRRRGSDRTTEVTWTRAQAERARLTRNPAWGDYPRAMLTARATAELCRILFPDVVAGIQPLEELEDGYPLEPRPEPAAPVRRSRRQPALPSNEGAPVGPAPGPAEAPAPALPPLPGEPGYDPPEATAAIITLPLEPTAPELQGAQGDPGPDVGDEPPATDEELARRKLMALARDAWPSIRTSQRELYRHALTALATRDRADGPKVSSRDLTTGERLTLTNLLNDVRSGALLTAAEPDGTVVFSSQTKSAAVTPPHDDEGRWTVAISER
jgi:hypothetical protein